jgi:hypothetical protein
LGYERIVIVNEGTQMERGCMRESFIGYFEPTAEMTAQRWKSGLIVLDTNVLLGLYRMPLENRKDIQKLLHGLKGRLWVPYHVMVEYHANRLDVLKGEYDAASKMERDIQTAFDGFKSKVVNEGNKRRQCWESISKQLDEIGPTIAVLLETARAERAHYIAPSESDTVREFLEDLLIGRVGPKPKNQAAVKAAEMVAAERFGLGIGPGYKDESKAGQLRVMDGLVYDRQFGDFMIWSQLLDHCKEKNIESVLFVTSDVKEDWWLDTKTGAGKRVQPELVMEMSREAKVHNFDICTLTQFAREAGKYLHVDVEQSTIDEVAKAEDPLVRDMTSALQEFIKSVKIGRLSRNGGRKYLKARSEDYFQTIEELSDEVLYADSTCGVGVSFDDSGQPVGKLAMPLSAFIADIDGNLSAHLDRFDAMGGVNAVEVYLSSRGATSTAPANPSFVSYVKKRIQAVRPDIGAVQVWIGGPGENPAEGTFFNLV